jgi:hypothetical protein
LSQAVFAKAFRGELVGQEVKEYVREQGEVMMAAEAHIDFKKMIFINGLNKLTYCLILTGKERRNR